MEISNRLNDLTTRARAGKLVPKDVSGGTFTISNLGPYGIKRFTAIINPPQVAILAIGTLQQEVVPDKDGEITVKPMAHLTVSTDHRVVDGVMAARFLNDLKTVIEGKW